LSAPVLVAAECPYVRYHRAALGIYR
jgi:hypothetical protein